MRASDVGWKPRFVDWAVFWRRCKQAAGTSCARRRGPERRALCVCLLGGRCVECGIGRDGGGGRGRSSREEQGVVSWFRQGTWEWRAVAEPPSSPPQSFHPQKHKVLVTTLQSPPPPPPHPHPPPPPACESRRRARTLPRPRLPFRRAGRGRMACEAANRKYWPALFTSGARDAAATHRQKNWSRKRSRVN